MNEEEKPKKQLNKYNCPWCGHKFKQLVGSSGRGHSRVSSQVICPACHNFLKTF